MPMITPLGVARQTTLMAQRTHEALEEGNTRDAEIFAREIELWITFAERKGWDTVAKHGTAQLALARGTTPYPSNR